MFNLQPILDFFATLMLWASECLVEMPLTVVGVIVLYFILLFLWPIPMLILLLVLLVVLWFIGIKPPPKY